MNDIGLIELNEAFAVQCIAFMREFSLKCPDEPRLNPWGGAIAFGHPLASSGVRLMIHLMHEFAEKPQVHYGLTTMCVGLGQGGSVIWENPQSNENKQIF
jgi:acetyl-CoA acyltransferase